MWAFSASASGLLAPASVSSSQGEVSGSKIRSRYGMSDQKPEVVDAWPRIYGNP